MRLNRKKWMLSALAALFLMTSGCASVKVDEIRSVKDSILSTAERLVVQDTETEAAGTEQGTENGTADVNGISDGKYVYECLDGETKKVYDEVLAAILEQRESVMVSTLDEKVLDQAYRAVNADYGGLFWVSGYQYTQYLLGEQQTGLAFSPRYTMSYEERQGTQAAIDASVEQILSGISPADSDYDKAKYVYEKLIQNVDYVPDADNNQNIISVFLTGQTVCQGYACATQYLLNLLDVPGVIVTGMANGQNHAWNLVLLDGNYYYIDTTWGDPTYANAGEDEKEVNYDYLNLTTSEITRTHTMMVDFPLPDCTAMEDNYYVREGRYYVDWYPDEIGALYHAAWENKTGPVAVKFADSALYAEAKDYFITDQHIGDFCDGLKSFRYRENQDLGVLTVYFS